MSEHKKVTVEDDIDVGDNDFVFVNNSDGVFINQINTENLKTKEIKASNSITISTAPGNNTTIFKKGIKGRNIVIVTNSKK
jgi:hypothetical protein